MLLGGIICWWPPRKKRSVALIEQEAMQVPDPVGVVSTGGGTLASTSLDIVDLANHNQEGTQ